MASIGDIGNKYEDKTGKEEFPTAPPGWYLATVVDEAKPKPTAKGGQQLPVRWSITGPSHQGITAFCNLNISCPSSEIAEEIAWQNYDRMCHALGFDVRTLETREFIGRTAEIKVDVEEYNGEKKNVVKGFKRPSGTAATPTSGEAKPWG